jgi:ankyrin repeat protein
MCTRWGVGRHIDAATEEECRKVTEVLLEHVDVTNRDNEGYTVLHCAAYYRCPAEVIRMIGKHMKEIGEDLNDKDNSKKCTALHCLFQAGTMREHPIPRVVSYEMVQALLRLGVKRDEPDGLSQKTPLHIAVLLDQTDPRTLTELADESCINKKDDEGNTPLHLLFSSKGKVTEDMVKALVDKGAKVYAKNNHHEEPVHILAQRQTYTETLFQYTKEWSKGRRACVISHAVKQGAINVMKLLLCEDNASGNDAPDGSKTGMQSVTLNSRLLSNFSFQFSSQILIRVLIFRQ